MNRYFTYCRKSTEEEERQVLSIEAQLTELREYAKRERLFIVKEFTESQTAKEPGRPVFNQMLGEIEQGNAQGILAWNPDRLARNSVDGGKIIYLIDTGKIKSLKFPTFWFSASADPLRRRTNASGKIYALRCLWTGEILHRQPERKYFERDKTEAPPWRNADSCPFRISQRAEIKNN